MQRVWFQDAYRHACNTVADKVFNGQHTFDQTGYNGLILAEHNQTGDSFREKIIPIQVTQYNDR